MLEDPLPSSLSLSLSLSLNPRGHFYQFGEVNSIHLVPAQKCAFINFTSRHSAEQAASGSFNKLVLKGISLYNSRPTHCDSWTCNSSIYAENMPENYATVELAFKKTADCCFLLCLHTMRVEQTNILHAQLTFLLRNEKYVYETWCNVVHHVCTGHRLKVLWGKGQGSSGAAGGGKTGERSLPPVPGLPAGEL